MRAPYTLLLSPIKMFYLYYAQVEVVTHTTSQLKYSCDDAKTKCLSKPHAGIIRSPCCLQNLGTGVKAVMRECKVITY